jgi:hypothetical protein
VRCQNTPLQSDHTVCGADRPEHSHKDFLLHPTGQCACAVWCVVCVVCPVRSNSSVFLCNVHTHLSFSTPTSMLSSPVTSLTNTFLSPTQPLPPSPSSLPPPSLSIGCVSCSHHGVDQQSHKFQWPVGSFQTQEKGFHCYARHTHYHFRNRDFYRTCRRYGIIRRKLFQSSYVSFWIFLLPVFLFIFLVIYEGNHFSDFSFHNTYLHSPTPTPLSPLLSSFSSPLLFFLLSKASDAQYCSILLTLLSLTRRLQCL